VMSDALAPSGGTLASLPEAPPANGALKPLHPRRRGGPRPVPPPPGDRGKGSRVSGTLDDVPHYVPVGHALRAWRLRAGLSQKRLSELTHEVVTDDTRRAYRERRPPRWKQGLSQFAVNRFENGVHSPLPQNAALLAAALSLGLEREGRPERVTVDSLQAGTTDRLLAFLLAEREAFTDGAARFWPALGISDARARELQAGAPWSAEELGAVALAYPTTADAVRDALIDQTRRQRGLPALRRYARRDRRHPEYSPSRPRATKEPGEGEPPQSPQQRGGPGQL
jgi:transcriptional regulator with XRE-family HTH domain